MKRFFGVWVKVNEYKLTKELAVIGIIHEQFILPHIDFFLL